MTNLTSVRPSTLAWVHEHLAAGERIAEASVLHGGLTAEMRRLTIAAPDGSVRDLVLRTFVDRPDAADCLARESDALTLLATTAVPAPELIAVDPLAAHPSLLMTWMPGRTVLTDDGLAERIPVLAQQLVAIHAVQPVERPPAFVTLTTADTVVTPPGANWSAAIDLIRRPHPPYEGRFLHRDYQPGNVLFEGTRLTAVVDWASTSWGPTDLDVAHCATNLALLHGPTWALSFVEAYEQAGGALSPDRHYWLVRDALSLSEDLPDAAQPWRDSTRPDLTPETVAHRLDAYLTTLMTGG
ncbi:phosphotransferase family protein [Kribbella sp. NPDC058245]|uniref:phosphotransferase family protein n=1 Tax=Kribbella sp. NPDC058245 TaxID=3346399 RepID=UPI0036E337CB